MKKFTRMIALVVMMGVLMSSFCVVSATTDGKVQMKRTQVLYENFDNGLTFDPYGGTPSPGIWERFLVAADATEDNVSVSGGVLKLTTTGAGSAVGARYFFEQTEKEYFITFKMRRPSGSANLSMQIYHNYDNTYRYGGGIPGFTSTFMNNYIENWVTVGIHIAEGGYITFYKKDDSATTFTKTASTSTIVSGKTSGSKTSWNQLKLFVEKDTAVTKFEFDDLYIYSIEPDDSNVIFSEDFEGAAASADLTARGFTLANSDYIGVAAEEGGNNTYAKLSGKSDGTVQLDTGTTINNYQLPSIMPEEFYASFRINMAESTGKSAPAIQLTFNGTMNGANANSNGRETAVRRINLLGSNTLFYAYYYDATAANNNASVRCDSIDSNYVFSPDNGWITLVLHVDGDQYTIYWKDEQNVTTLTKVAGPLTAQYIATNTTATDDVNYLKFYQQNREGDVWIDDIMICTPGLHVTPVAQANGKATVKLVNGSLTDKTVIGLLGSYNVNTLMNASISEQLPLPAGGAAKVELDASGISDSNTNKIYLWESLGNLTPLTGPVEF